jgi:ABC-type transporter Mla MlaB component
MFRIKIQRAAEADIWTLYGRLSGDVVGELEQNWKSARNERKRVIDLTEVTSVDERGEQVLIEIMRDGATFVARGVYCTNLVETLTARSKQEA